jgi:hypothetical protein
MPEFAQVGLIEDLPKTSPRKIGSEYDVFLLSKSDDAQNTVLLDEPIANDQKSPAGKPVAWTRGQRYVNLERLSRRPSVRFTSQLESS